MLTFRSISASIRVDGKDLPHFQPEYDNVTNTVTCWIHSLPGKEYSIWMRKEAETAYDIAAHVHLDGSEDYATSFCLTNTSSERRRSAIPYGANKERPLVFADGVYDDQYDLSSDASSATNPNQGSIKITAQRITLINSEQSAWHPFASTHHEDYDYRRLPGNLTQLGKTRTSRLRYHKRAVPYKPSDVVPFVTFIFLHKPVARAPSPISMPSPSPSPEPEPVPVPVRSTGRVKMPVPSPAPVVPTPVAALAAVMAPSLPTTTQRRPPPTEALHPYTEEGDEAEEAELLAIEAKKASLNAQQAVLEARIAAITAERAAAKAERTATLLSGRRYR